MKLKRFSVLVLALLIGGTLGVAAADQGVVDSTSAAWSDRAQTTAIATAGTWKTTTTSACTAYGANGAPIAGCTVLSSSRYDGWGLLGTQTRNYYLNFGLPTGTRTFSFDVDLTSVAGNGSSSWSWKTSRVLAGGHFTARDGWTCAELPRVRGNSPAWSTNTIYFQVTEGNYGLPAMCS
jgi:hypothetical protein